MSNELTTEELSEALEYRYKARINSKLNKKKTARIIIGNPDYV